MSFSGISHYAVFCVIPLLAAVNFFACEGRSHSVTSASPETLIVASPVQTSNEDELLRQYLQYAASTNPTDHKKLIEALSSKDFLFRLDTRDDYRRKSVSELRLAKLFQAMKENGSLAMRETLLTLARTNKPGDCDACDELLILTLATMRPATPEVIRFYTVHSDVESIQLSFVIDALCENASAPAIALLEKRLSEAKYPPEMKISWMRQSLLRHRRNATLLAGADRLLTSSLPKNLRPSLVEALFDYRPGEWYRERNPPTPDVQPLTPEAKRLLQKIGAFALKKITLNATQRNAITKTISELR